MSIKILIDMNLSPAWVPLLEHAGWTSVHWSVMDMPDAPDQTIMDWALTNGYVVFTHDLDFSTALALTRQKGPSVLQVRGQNVLPARLGNTVIAVLNQHEPDLESGALIVIEENRKRVRILPI